MTKPEPMKSVADEWERFWKAVAPPGTPEDQHREMRKAFYAGAQAIFHGVLRSLSEGPESSPEDEAFMERLHRELSEFSQEMIDEHRRRAEISAAIGIAFRRPKGNA